MYTTDQKQQQTARRVRITTEGERIAVVTGSLRAFLRNNADDPETCEQVSALQPGQSVVLGGGAGWQVRVEVLR